MIKYGCFVHELITPTTLNVVCFHHACGQSFTQKLHGIVQMVREERRSFDASVSPFWEKVDIIVYNGDYSKSEPRRGANPNFQSYSGSLFCSRLYQGFISISGSSALLRITIQRLLWPRIDNPLTKADIDGGCKL